MTLVSGWRVKRQDNFIRRLNGWGWNTVVLLLFGRTIHDIDCGFKVFRREVLNHIHIESNGAMIDTEMLAEMRARGFKMTDVPVTHLPRTAGSPTGANLKVIARAFRDLFKFRLRLSRELREEKQARKTADDTATTEIAQCSYLRTSCPTHSPISTNRATRTWST